VNMVRCLRRYLAALSRVGDLGVDQSAYSCEKLLCVGVARRSGALRALRLRGALRLRLFPSESGYGEPALAKYERGLELQLFWPRRPSTKRLGWSIGEGSAHPAKLRGLRSGASAGPRGGGALAGQTRLLSASSRAA
jgi:hypothetical protein